MSPSPYVLAAGAARASAPASVSSPVSSPGGTSMSSTGSGAPSSAIGTSSYQSFIPSATIPDCGMRYGLASVSKTGTRRARRPVSSSLAARAAPGEPPSRFMAERVARAVLTRYAALDPVVVILRASALALS